MDESDGLKTGEECGIYWECCGGLMGSIWISWDLPSGKPTQDYGTFSCYEVTNQ